VGDDFEKGWRLRNWSRMILLSIGKLPMAVPANPMQLAMVGLPREVMRLKTSDVVTTAHHTSWF
jgi:hypothetical protein